jgi:hypothetical protein
MAIIIDISLIAWVSVAVLALWGWLAWLTK